MTRYLFIYRSTPPESEPSAEAMQAIMTAWSTWIESGMQAGWMVEPGNPLEYTGKMVSDDGVTDGPFAESKELIGGYSFIQAESLDAAVALTAGCPVLADGGRVEVRPVVEFEVN
ncbi:MAG: YciI family protein [Pseudomonadota bacterium]